MGRSTPFRYNLKMRKFFQSKKAVLLFTFVSLIILWSEILWLRNIGSDVYRFEKWQFGLILLPWILTTIGFLLFVYLSWFRREVPIKKVKTVLFGLVSSSFIFVWGGIWVAFFL